VTKPLCVVTGASGALGPAIVAAFHDAGFDVRPTSRHSAIRSDVTSLEDMQRVIDGADCVVHAAAMLHINDPSPALHDVYRRVNIGGTENAIRAAERTGVSRFVHLSTIAVYGPAKTVLTEGSTPSPDTIYGRTKLESEQIALASGFGTVLRLAAVYGGRVKGNYLRLARAVARRRFVSIGSGSNRRTVVFDRDAAAAAVLAAQKAGAVSQVFNVTDGGLHTVRDIVNAIAAAAGTSSPRLSIPAAPVRIAAAVAEDAARFFHLRTPVTRALIEKYLEDVAVDGTKIQRDLGFTPAYDLSRGWAEAIREMRHDGLL